MPHTPSRIRDPTCTCACSDPTRWCQLCPSADARPDGASGNLLVGPLAERQCHGLHSAQQASSRTPSCAYITSCVQLRGAEHRGQAKGRSHPRCSGCDGENAQRSQIRSVAGPCPSFATRCDEHSRQKRLYGGRGEEEEEHDAREFARERHGTHAHSSKVRVWQRRRQHTRKETGGAALCRGPTKDEEWERREGKADALASLPATISAVVRPAPKMEALLAEHAVAAQLIRQPRLLGVSGVIRLEGRVRKLMQPIARVSLCDKRARDTRTRRAMSELMRRGGATGGREGAVYLEVLRWHIPPALCGSVPRRR